MPGARQVRQPRHCRHCLLGDCPGDCLLADGRCIHHVSRGLQKFGWRALLSRRWWRRVFWGN
jgi:hypothetical protein